MFTIIYRIIKYGFQQFSRNSLLSAATVAVMVMALIVLLGINIFGYLTDETLAVLKDKIDISVYFKTNAPEDEVLRVKRSLEGLPEVKQVEYISRDQALELFKENHKDDADITQAITELGDNPLSAALNIKANNPGQFAAISTYLSNNSLAPIVEKISFYENKTVIDHLAVVIDTVQKAGTILAALLSLIAGLVVFNTIRLAIYSSRDEIGIMRLVGASNLFVRGPYIVAGILYGIAAGLLSILLTLPAVIFISPYVKIFIPEVNLQAHFFSSIHILILTQIGFGMILGVVSSYWAMRRYLKV